MFSVFHHLQKDKQRQQRHSLKLGKKRRESSKRNYYIISPRVIIKAIIIRSESNFLGYSKSPRTGTNMHNWFYGQNNFREKVPAFLRSHTGRAKFILYFVVCWVWKIKHDIWSKRMAITWLATQDPRNCSGPEDRGWPKFRADPASPLPVGKTIHNVGGLTCIL